MLYFFGKKFGGNMNDSKIKNKICKINEKSLKKFDEIIMDSIGGSKRKHLL